jgi:Nicotinamide mononucleotide transporter.|nr:MAG TPA: Nicotinamide mononucleotide transporter [Caudoviricetes sp.]
MDEKKQKIRSILKILFETHIVMLAVINIIVFAVGRESFIGFLMLNLIVAGHYFMYSNSMWANVTDIGFLFLYATLALKYRIYSEFITKVAVLIPLTILSWYDSARNKKFYENPYILRIKKKTNWDVTKTATLCVIIFLLFREALESLNDPTANVSAALVITSIIATWYHYKHDQQKWLYWIIYNSMCLSMWIYYEHGIYSVGPTLYAYYFLITSILGYVEFVVFKNEPNYRSLFNLDLYDANHKEEENVR